MHDMSRDSVTQHEPISRSPAQNNQDTRFDLFVQQYGAFITPLICLFLAAAAWIKGEHTPEGTYLALAAVALAGYPILRNSVVSTISKRKLNAEVLVSIALIASVWVGEYVAGALVALMMVIGELLEDITIAKTGRAVRSLMDLKPVTARIIRGGIEFRTAIEKVIPGDVAVVQPGEKIPVDGTVIEGRGEVDQAPITGESLPVIKEVGADVHGGTLNQLGTLKVQVTRVGEETTLAKIIYLVQKAQAEKPPIERIADRFAAWFTPIMLLLAAAVWGVTGEVLRAVTLLVAACPCAMVIATPTAVVAAIGNAARKGILIKGGAVLEKISQLTAVAFDKTGTLTYGTATIRFIRGFAGTSEGMVLRLAATAETRAGHPLAEAVLKHAHEQKLSFPEPEDTSLIVGRGVIAQSNNETIMVGNAALYADRSIALSPEASQFLAETAESGATGILVGIGERIVGGIALSDAFRPDAKTAIANIRTMGIGKIIMLTGDTGAVARHTSEGVGLDEIAADLLPDQKLTIIQKLRAQGETVAMVGDGINDAPSLVEADVGIAMGVMGTDTAIEAADIALTSDDLNQVAEAIALSRKTISNIKQSFLISLVINAAAMWLAATGGIGPIAGAVIHNIGSVVVVGNSSRLIGYRYKKPAH